MYKVYGYTPKVRCICGRESLVDRAVVCGCGTTLRITRYPIRRRLQPMAIAPDHLDLRRMPFKQPKFVEWVKS